MGEGIGKSEMKWRNWYQNEVNEEIKGVDSRNKLKHNERSNQLFLERMMSVAEQEWPRMESVYCETLNRDEVIKVGRLSSCENFIGKWEELVYSIRSVIMGQWRERRMGVIWQDLESLN